MNALVLFLLFLWAPGGHVEPADSGTHQGKEYAAAGRGEPAADTSRWRASVSKLDSVHAGQDSVVYAGGIRMYWADEIVVTAKRVPSSIENLALSVSVLGPKEIELSDANSSTDMAGDLPGVFIQRTGRFGRSDVNIRGLGSRGRRTVILVDGRPERMALFDCTVTHSFLLHNVERIEVVRGPSSVLYGSGAVGGVFNVISREPGEKLDVDLKTAGGSDGTAVVSGRAGKRWGYVNGTVSADYRRSDGHVEHSGYEGTDVVARAGVEISPAIELSINGKYFEGFKEEPLRATDDPGLVTDTWNDYKRGSVELLIRRKGGKRNAEARYYRNFGEHEFSDGWHSTDATDGAILHASVQPSAGLELSGGADYRFQHGERLDEPAGQWSKWDAGIYLSAEYNYLNYANVSAGLRYSTDEVSGGEICPTFGIVGRPWNGASLRGVAAKGFRYPQINELYMYPISNENLEVETVWNYEIGLRQKMGDLLVCDIAVFRMNGENFIELIPNSAPPPLYRFQNAGSFDFFGLEASVEAEWKDVLRGRISYSYLDLDEWTRGRPGRQLNLSASYTRGRARVGVTGKYVDDYFAGNNREDEIGGYTVFGLFAETKLVKALSSFLAVRNIFDEEYVLYVDLPGGSSGLYEMPRRNVLFGLKYGL